MQLAIGSTVLRLAQLLLRIRRRYPRQQLLILPADTANCLGGSIEAACPFLRDSWANRFSVPAPKTVHLIDLSNLTRLAEN
jgi:hypothetical protein